MSAEIDQQPIEFKPQCPSAERNVVLCGVEDYTAGDMAACLKECPFPGGVEVDRATHSPFRLFGPTKRVCAMMIDSTLQDS